ncbi:MAG: HD domain-containing protein [Gammaproteobacteria bacterium]|nr:HD domain-containing protein [Gammaproteobacteria bacterium]
MSIKNILFFSIIGLMVITVSTIMFSTYTTTQQMLIGHAHQVMDNVSSEAIDRSTAFLQPAELAAELTQKLANHNVVSQQNSSAMERYFFEQLKLYPQFTGIYYGTRNGDFVYVSRDDSFSKNGYRTKIINIKDNIKSVNLHWRDQKFNSVTKRLDTEDNYDPRIRPWYLKALKHKRMVWTEPYIFFSSQQPGVTISSPVFETGLDHSISGVVGVDIEISQISSFLSSLKIGLHGSAFIIDTHGQVLAHPDASKIKRKNNDQTTFNLITEIDDPIARAAFRSLQLPLSQTYILDTKTFTQFIHDKINYQAVFTPFQQHQWPWIIGIYVPENDYLGVFHENQQQNIYLAIIIAVFASLLGYFLSRSLSRPIIQLGHQSRAIMKGDWDNTAPIATPYKEIKQTAEAFSAMTTTLKQQQNENNVLNKTLLENSLATIFRLSQAAEYKIPVSSNHLSRMAQLTSLIARALGKDKHYCEMILYAAPMHDIGYLGIADQILLKPGKLDMQEWESIKTHPVIGAEILKNPETEMLSMARKIILTHHEKWNGFGYPKGLAGTDIPLEGRICALADAFDTMASERVYKKAYELDAIFREVKVCRGSHFDPKCVDALLEKELEVRRLYSSLPSLDRVI